MPQLGPRISKNTSDWLEKNFSSRNAGAEFLLDAFPTLYQRGLAELYGKFAGNELALLLDCFNGLSLTPSLLGQHLDVQVEDSISLNGLDTKWQIDRDSFLSRLNELSFFERACLEIWLRAFWETDDTKKKPESPTSAEGWTAQLASKPLEIPEGSALQ